MIVSSVIAYPVPRPPTVFVVKCPNSGCPLFHAHDGTTRFHGDGTTEGEAVAMFLHLKKAWKAGTLWWPDECDYS